MSFYRLMDAEGDLASRKAIAWCAMTGAKPTTLDDNETLWSAKSVLSDDKGFKSNPGHRKVYDKLWVATSQGLQGGACQPGDPPAGLSYPVFVKPRWGHRSAQSRGCAKVSSASEWPTSVDEKNGPSIWTTYLDGEEGMSDLVLADGNIVYAQTYVYGYHESKNTDAWKYVSSETPLPGFCASWAMKHMKGYTGFLNLQYKGSSIFEVALRPARTGMYLRMTGSYPLVNSINHLVDTGEWVPGDFSYAPFYVFKCICPYPIVALPPQHLLTSLDIPRGATKFCEYYFEDVGNEGTAFCQFVENDLSRGLHNRTALQRGMHLYQLFTLLLCALLVCAIAVGQFKLAVVIFLIVLCLESLAINNTPPALASWAKMGLKLPTSTKR